MVVVGGRVVHVGGQPDDVAHAPRAMKREQLGDLELAAEGRAGIAVGHGLEVGRPSGMARPSGMSLAITFQVARDARERVLQPAQLRGAEDRARRPRAGLPVRRVRRRGTLRRSRTKTSSDGP